MSFFEKEEANSLYDSSAGKWILQARTRSSLDPLS